MTARPTRPAGSPIDIFKRVLTEKYAEFSGRARRAEYWWFTLLNGAATFIVILIGVLLAGGDSGSPWFFLYVVYWLATVVPTLAVTVRRLHDTGRSGAMFFISFIPFVGPLILLYFMFTDGQPHPNQYGPSPKYGDAS